MSLAGSSNAANTQGNTANPNEVPASLDQLLEEITTSNNAVELNQRFKAFSPKDVRDTLLASTLPSGQDPLAILDPEANTIGYLYILCARLSSTTSPTPSLRVIEEFCTRFNPEHARLAPERVTTLAKGIIRVAESSHNVKYALGPLLDLVTRYPPSPNHLTTLHRLFISTCVSTKHFTAALPVLSSPIMHVESSVSDLTYNDNLVYHYAGGIALGALKKWREAEEFFEICVTAPAQVPAAIQLEAQKKLTLVQLILYGKASTMPKYTNATLVRLLKSSPYGNLSRAYPQPKSTLTSLVAKDAEIFTSENNNGLVQQVLDRAPRWLIRKLTATYLTLGLADIAKETGIESEAEVRAIILDMIDSGEINASISVHGTVTFSDTVTNITKADVDRALAHAQEQSKLLVELDRAMNVNKDYLTKALKYKDEAWGGGDEDVGYGMHSGWDNDSVFP